MAFRNLRHLRLFLSVAECRSITTAAEAFHISQPAVTQAIAKLERIAQGTLFHRSSIGLCLTERGHILHQRAERAFRLLDPALREISSRLPFVVSFAQLSALVSVCEVENFTLAARRLGLAQPTIHRAVSQLERDAGRLLFQRTGFGLVAGKTTRELAQAIRLAFRELEKAQAELAENDGLRGGPIVVGALPISRSIVLPGALIQFRKYRPLQAVQIIDGRYDELLSSLRRGDVDMLIGALRYPPPVNDISQIPLFEDRLSIVVGRGHPLLRKKDIELKDLVHFPWLVGRTGTPGREQFEAIFAKLSLPTPQNLIETGSVLMMREMLAQSEFLACVSRLQVAPEVEHGLLRYLDVEWDDRPRSIGITTRLDWKPTSNERVLLDCILQEVAQRFGDQPDIRASINNL